MIVTKGKICSYISRFAGTTNRAQNRDKQKEFAHFDVSMLLKHVKISTEKNIVLMIVSISTKDLQVATPV